MGAHPVHITVDNNRQYTLFSFNERKSVPFPAVKALFEALQSARRIPHSATLTLDEDDNRITIAVRRPQAVPRDRRTGSFKQWATPLRDTVNSLNIAVQSKRSPEEVADFVDKRLRRLKKTAQ